MSEPDPMGMALLIGVNNLICFGIGILAAWAFGN